MLSQCWHGGPRCLLTTCGRHHHEQGHKHEVSRRLPHGGHPRPRGRSIWGPSEAQRTELPCLPSTALAGRRAAPSASRAARACGSAACTCRVLRDVVDPKVPRGCAMCAAPRCVSTSAGSSVRNGARADRRLPSATIGCPHRACVGDTRIGRAIVTVRSAFIRAWTARWHGKCSGPQKRPG